MFASRSHRIDRRKQLGPLNAVERPRPFHVQGGKPKIPVVVQGQLNNFLKLFVGKKFLPAQLRDFHCSGGRLRVPVSFTLGPRVRDRRSRSTVVRGKG